MKFIRAIITNAPMKIPINTPIIGNEELNEVKSILKKGSLTSAANIGGKNVQEFEKRAASYLKSKYIIAVNSGTAALQAALFALNIKTGDEVLLPSFSFVATANVVISVGAKPVFVDILKENYTMDPDNLKKKISKKSKVIIPVHLYGNVSFIKEISEIAKKNSLRIIEDAAQSLGSTYKGKHTGTFSDMGCYSLYPGKVMTAGEGGFIATNNNQLKEKLRMIRNHGMLHGYDTRTFGLNLRLPEISAAIAKIQIKKLPSFLKKRRKNAKILSELLSNIEIKKPKERKYEKVNWYLFTIAIKKRDQLLKKLNSKGISATTYYPTPIHKTPFYQKKIKLSITDWAASHVLSLPVHPLVNSKNLELMANVIRREFKK